MRTVAAVAALLAAAALVTAPAQAGHCKPWVGRCAARIARAPLRGGWDVEQVQCARTRRRDVYRCEVGLTQIRGGFVTDIACERMLLDARRVRASFTAAAVSECVTSFRNAAAGRTA